jgi:hypothetical protein
MADLESFSAGGNRKWSTIDCRFLVNLQTRFMMHVGTNSPDFFPGSGTMKYARNTGAGNVLFTNVLPDAKEDNTSFFDMSLRNAGGQSCQTAGGMLGPNRAGGITTWINDWTRASGISQGQPLEDGGCLVGRGAHFCSRDRVGVRLSNAGRQWDSCRSSSSDTMYWAWGDDDHGCDDNLQIGTGCQSQIPTFRYNYMFIH